MTLLFITHPDCLLHEMGSMHPECPERLSIIQDQMVQSNFEQTIKIHQAIPAADEQISLIHPATYLAKLRRLSPTSGYMPLDADTIMNPYTLSAAKLAVGSVIQAVEMVLSSQFITAFCAIRPPGHHAESNQAMGFCFFNNLSVGVAYALKKYQLNRIAIIDFDVHRGNGTEAIFQNHPNILMVDSYERDLYPAHIPPVIADNIIQIPLGYMTTGQQFREAWMQQGFPNIISFKPELIFISAGFDGHRHDNLSSMQLEEDDYSWISQNIKKIADEYCHGRIISVLEGGYALDILGKCVVEHLKAM